MNARRSAGVGVRTGRVPAPAPDEPEEPSQVSSRCAVPARAAPTPSATGNERAQPTALTAIALTSSPPSSARYGFVYPEPARASEDFRTTLREFGFGPDAAAFRNVVHTKPLTGFSFTT